MLEKFVYHRTLANLLMMMFIGVGLYALPNLRKESFPDFDASEILIAMEYRGASAEDVEQGICLRIEDAIDSVQNIKEVTSVAQEGSAAITIEIEDGADVTEALSDIEVEVDAITDFPDGAEDPIITQLNRSVAVMTLAVSGPMSTADLKDYCEDLKRRLRQLPLSPIVEIEGFSDRQLRIELDSDALRRLGLSAAEIATTIGVQNLDLPWARLKRGTKTSCFDSSKSDSVPTTSKTSSSPAFRAGPRFAWAKSVASSTRLPMPRIRPGWTESGPAFWSSKRPSRRTPSKFPNSSTGSWKRNDAATRISAWS